MTEQAAVFRGMVFRQGRLLVLIMAFEAECFSLFFVLYLVEVLVDFIMGQWSGGFLGGVEQEDQNTCTYSHKEHITQKQFGLFLHFY